MRLVVFCILFISSLPSFSQRQLLLLKKSSVMHRFYPGENIYIKIKGTPDRIHGYINNMLEDALVINTDTIPFHSIERTYLYESRRRNSSGSKLVVAGCLLFAIDQVNEVAVRKNGLSIDSGVSIASLTLAAVGLPLMLIKKRSQQISYKYRFLMVKEGDPLYR
jgi:hypothetical protein